MSERLFPASSPFVATYSRLSVEVPDPSDIADRITLHDSVYLLQESNHGKRLPPGIHRASMLWEGGNADKTGAFAGALTFTPIKYPEHVASEYGWRQDIHNALTDYIHDQGIQKQIVSIPHDHGQPFSKFSVQVNASQVVTYHLESTPLGMAEISIITEDMPGAHQRRAVSFKSYAHYWTLAAGIVLDTQLPKTDEEARIIIDPLAREGNLPPFQSSAPFIPESI